MTEFRGSPPPSPDGEVVVYEAPHDGISVDVRLQRETLWLTQRQIADLFRTTASNVSQHLGNVFADGELDPSATSQDFAIV